MIKREFWLAKIREAWKKRPLVWLSGVRRVGKTTLAREFPEALFLNCELPSVRETLRDPEFFYKSLSRSMVVFDEIHRLPDPSMVLKVGTDEFPKLKILATGSSTLTASRKFRDSMTGRKYEVRLLPVLATECPAFAVLDMKKRLLHGGLPEALLSDTRDIGFYSEWVDSFYARDVQELFRVDKRYGFYNLFELLLRRSASLVDFSGLARQVGISRPTVMSYMEILQHTHAIRLLRPYHGGGRQELLHQPKMYGFDTGFVCHFKGWDDLRDEDCGMLWEHLVYDFLSSRYQSNRLYFWRDKRQREVDFVVAAGRRHLHAIECKWSPESFESRGIEAFRESYPLGKNVLVSPKVARPYRRKIRKAEIVFTDIEHLPPIIEGK